MFWSWDATNDWTFTGQTGDACALFDTDGDGLIGLAICARIANAPSDPSTLVQSAGSPYAFGCADTSNNRCSGPIQLTPTDAQLSATVAITASDPFANLDPDQDHPHDASIEVSVLRSFLPTGAVLVNVCSYPDASNGGNNNPFDCIAAPDADPDPRLALEVSSTTSVISADGQMVDYAYLVTNSGDRELASITVTDDLVAAVSCPQTQLSVAASMTCTGRHTVTAAEVDAGGSLTNTATADSDLTDPVIDTLAIPIQASASAMLTEAGTRCAAYASGAALPVETGSYAVRRGETARFLPRAVTYFSTVVAPSADFTVTVAQSNDGDWPLLPVRSNRNIAVYDAECDRMSIGLAAVDPATGVVTIPFTSAASDAAYHVAVEYSLSTLAGEPVGASPPSVTFTFMTDRGSGPIGASVEQIVISGR